MSNSGNNNINLYSGELVYSRGMWTKDTTGENFVQVDPDYYEFYDYKFNSVTAKSVEQLIYILGKRIQEEKELSYPVYIDWREIKAKITGTLPSSSKRFDELVPSV